MRVTLKLEGHLREFFPHLQQAVSLEFAGPVSVAEVLKQAGIPPELPGSVVCDGLRVGREHIPQDGDLLVVISPLAGG